MDTMKPQWPLEELRRRRQQITMTLRHLGKERAEVERNTEWVNRNAYERRAQLLSHVHSWYVEEIVRIDEALTRSVTHDCRICVACDERLDEQRLESVKTPGFCSGCEVPKEAEL
jgi:RNA polymerase-binding transcription factor DksA